MFLPIETIDEDPNQPRSEFDPEALQQLADTIRERGVRQPVSVRPHPQQPGRWMLNFGARRLRASKIAGKTEIAAFVDSTADSYDQVIENEQREGLQPLELALFVGRRLAEGQSQAEIARRLGKTRGYVTFACALVDAPGWLLDLYRSGRCRGIAELYELRKLHEGRPDAVEQWLATMEHVGRADVQALKNDVKHSDLLPKTQPAPGPAHDESRSDPPLIVPSPETKRVFQANERTSEATRHPIEHFHRPATLWARHEGADVTVELDALPDADGYVFVLTGKRERVAVPANRVQLLRITRG